MSLLMLQPLLNNQSSKKKGCKGDMVEAFCASGLEMIFALLVETIAILVQIAPVEV